MCDFQPTFLFILPFTDFIQQSLKVYMPPTNCIGSTDTLRHFNLHVYSLFTYSLDRGVAGPF